ncbi:MAG: hypothetical protein PHY45_13585 [Rhodocyclaceae bacterium]|nr:hypothetical protein [Rhodocyclaceae bacterium]
MTPEANPKRRKFLLALLAGAGTAAAVLAEVRTTPEAAAPPAASTPAFSGHGASAHVRRYDRSHRI